MQKLSYSHTRQLLRCTSKSTCQDFEKYKTNETSETSSSSIQSSEDEYRRCAIKWLMEFDRRVTKDTNYLSVWYLNLVLKNGLSLKESNWQLIAASIMMFASKMNQIYPPSINSILKRCKCKASVLTKQALIQMQGEILNILDFNVAIQSPYNLLSQILEGSGKDIEECQKLLKIIIYNKEINLQSSQTIAYAIIYLISRARVDNLVRGQTRLKVKVTAQKIYSYYKQTKRGHQAHRTKPAEDSYLSKPDGYCPIKQDSVDIYSSLGSYTTSDQNNIRKAQQSYIQFTRANSYKFIPRQKPFSQSTNFQTANNKLSHCHSTQQISENRDMYLYS